MNPRVDYRTQCVLCAARGRRTLLEAGHVCPACLVGLADSLDDIVRLAAMASIEPRTGTGQGARTVPASRPPIDITGIDPALTLIDLGCGPVTILAALEDWERLVRDARSMAPYGIASSARDAGAYGQTTVTLTGVCGFLRASLPWWAENPDQPVDDFAGEIRTCRRALVRFDPDREPHSTMIRCPTLMDEGECGYRLHYSEPDEQVTCRRCGVTRDAMTLITVALSDSRGEVWVDPEAAEKETGVAMLTLKRWAARGLIHASHGRYDLREIHLALEGERTSAHLSLLRRVTAPT